MYNFNLLVTQWSLTYCNNNLRQPTFTLRIIPWHPLRDLLTKSCFPTDLPSTASWCAVIVAAHTLRAEGTGLCSNPSCRKESTTLIGHLQGSFQWEEHQSTNAYRLKWNLCHVDGALAEGTAFNTAGGSPPRTSTYHPGTTWTVRLTESNSMPKKEILCTG